MWPEIGSSGGSGMHRTSTIEALDSHKNQTTRSTNENIGFPSILQKEQTKNGMFVRRNKTFSSRVPAPGHEYDYRRTPDGSGRATPRMIRPCVPPDTLGIERLHLNNSPSLSKNWSKGRHEIGHNPTPVPSESDPKENSKNTDISAPLPTARSAWDRTYVCSTNYDDLPNITNDVDFQNTSQMDTLEFRDKAGRRLKPANQKDAYDVIISDIEHDDNSNTAAQTYVHLTEDVLYMHNNRPVNKDKRISKWLADLRDQKCNQVPAHLPEINGSRKYTMLSVEDV